MTAIGILLKSSGDTVHTVTLGTTQKRNSKYFCLWLCILLLWPNDGLFL